MKAFPYINMIVIMLFVSLVPTLVFAANIIVRNTTEGIEFRNELVSITISEDAELLSCIDLSTNNDIAEYKKKIAYIVTSGGKRIEASKATLNDNVLHLTIGEHRIELLLSAYGHYFTLEVNNEDLSGVEILAFANLKFRYDFNNQNSFIATGLSMTLQTNHGYFPSGESKEIIGLCTSHTGFKGAKLAVVACKRNVLRDILKEIYSTIPFGELPLTTSGGPFALDNEVIRRDCYNTRDADPTKIQEYIDVFSKYGISQFDFDFGPQTFIQGSFSFPALGSAARFKEQITDPLLDAGIVSTMHTFSFYISDKAVEILSNPIWQQQLEFRESFALKDNISPTENRIDSFNQEHGLIEILKDPFLKAVHSPYFLIDNEIVKYYIGANGQIEIERGQCGTIASTHMRGAVARLIGGYYSHIAPQPGSNLFYEVARRTASAYNEGGFKGVYFDALDGLKVHLEKAGLSDYLWFYGASFVNEFLKYCVESPIVEYSILYPSIWSARGRGGAWDIPYRGYKRFIREHINYNKALMNRLYVTTLGWFNFYPIRWKEPSNYSTKYLFVDDVDYLGYLSIAYDQTMVYNNIGLSDVRTNPALRRNLEQFSLYNNLKRDGYFTNKVLDVLRTEAFEYKLIQKGSKWGFKEAEYCRSKLRDIDNNQLIGINPFKKQKPFIRLENLYSSDCKSQINLLSYNKAVDFTEQACNKVFPTPLDLREHLGIRVKVKGNGFQSTDAICIRLVSSSGAGVADYIVRLNFDEWRDVILTDIDNAEGKNLLFQGKDDNIHRVHRFHVDFSAINTIEVFKSGDCKNVKIESIDAVNLINKPLNNPRIEIGQSSITFMDSIQSGEYIEYSVGNRSAVVYDRIGNRREISISPKRNFIIPHGGFSVKVASDSIHKGTPTEVVLTIGVFGRFIHD